MRTSLLACAWLLNSCAALADAPAISPAKQDAQGLLVHEVESEYQSGKTQIRVLLPDVLEAGRRYPVVYVLPVEAQNEQRYGVGLAEVRKLDLANLRQVIFVAPTFAQLPWFADHATDRAIRQESYLLKVVVPFVERTYPALDKCEGRLLLGFSKSGWGAWSLLLRHPETFARAAAWDAPLMMEWPSKYGSQEIFGTPENFARYRVAELLRKQSANLGAAPRLILTGYGGFRREHEQAHALLDELKVPHVYRDGPQRMHDWHSGWVAEAVELLLAR